MKTNGTIAPATSHLLKLLLLINLLLLPLASQKQTALACNRVYFGDKSLENIACLCNATHCDHKLEFEWPSNDDEAFVLIQSSKGGARFERSVVYPPPTAAANTTTVGENNSTSKNFKPHYELEVQVNRRKQQVLGYGGAFTDSACKLMVDLNESVRMRMLEDYFGNTGLQYNFGRVPIGGTDMSWRAYSYDDLPVGQTDLELKHFKLQPEDLLYKVPIIKRANELRQKLLGANEELKLMAASWSAPSWMKSNSHLVQGRLLGNSSSAPYYNAYARYQIKFLHEYEKLNLTIWALSPQNEPHSPKRVGPIKINFNSVNFEPHEMADYLEGSLVPELLKANKKPDSLKLFIWDDTLDGLASYQEAALASPQVSNFTLGLAIHWYTTGLSEKPYRMLYEARRKLPPKYCLMSTEASFIGRPRPGEWWRGERYARDVIENLRAGSVGWLDWNLALNMSGGPTWSNNILDAAILVDSEAQSYYKNPMFYALGQVTRFIKPNSYILQSSILEAATNNSTLSNQSIKNPTTTTTVDQPEGGALPADELALVAAELEEPLRVEGGRVLKRRLALVVLNRAKQVRRVRLSLIECHLKREHKALELELEPSSLTSLAFVC